MHLAALLLEAERPEEAVTVIDHIEPWAANYIQLIEEQHRLSDAPLDPLWETDAFHGSELAARESRDANEQGYRRVRRIRPQAGPGAREIEWLVRTRPENFRPWVVHDGVIVGMRRMPRGASALSACELNADRFTTPSR